MNFRGKFGKLVLLPAENIMTFLMITTGKSQCNLVYVIYTIKCHPNHFFSISLPFSIPTPLIQTYLNTLYLPQPQTLQTFWKIRSVIQTELELQPLISIFSHEGGSTLIEPNIKARTKMTLLFLSFIMWISPIQFKYSTMPSSTK